MSTEEREGCRVCALFGGPHAVHAGWRAAGAGSAEREERGGTRGVTPDVAVVDEAVEFSAGAEPEPAAPVPDAVLQMLGDALPFAGEGQTVRLRVVDRMEPERWGEWSVVKAEGVRETDRDRKWDLVRDIRRRLEWQEGEGE